MRFSTVHLNLSRSNASSNLSKPSSLSRVYITILDLASVTHHQSPLYRNRCLASLDSPLQSLHGSDILNLLFEHYNVSGICGYGSFGRACVAFELVLVMVVMVMVVVMLLRRLMPRSSSIGQVHSLEGNLIIKQFLKLHLKCQLLTLWCSFYA